MGTVARRREVEERSWSRIGVSYCRVADDLRELDGTIAGRRRSRALAAEGLIPARVAVEYNHRTTA